MNRSRLIYNTNYDELYRMCKMHYEVLSVYNDDDITSIKRHTTCYVQKKIKTIYDI